MSAALATFALPAAALTTWALIRGLAVGVGAALAADALEPSKELFGILGGCAIVFAAGLFDDLRALPPLAKLASQVGAAALVIATGLQVQIVANDVLATAIALLWLVLALAVGLACAGFLPFNLRVGKPAAIFMGDSGSQVLGFALAALGLSASWKAAGTTVAALFLPILVLA